MSAFRPQEGNFVDFQIPKLPPKLPLKLPLNLSLLDQFCESAPGARGGWGADVWLGRVSGWMHFSRIYVFNECSHFLQLPPLLGANPGRRPANLCCSPPLPSDLGNPPPAVRAWQHVPAQPTPRSSALPTVVSGLTHGGPPHIRTCRGHLRDPYRDDP